MNTNSNTYTVAYAAVMVIVVAFLLAFVSSALRETQEANVANDIKGQILTSLRYDKAAIDVEKTYAEVIEETEADGLPLYVAQTPDGVKYVIPMTGRGLWGGLWGYVALDEDKQTVYGAYFYHESETAGLGARIGEAEFRDLFRGKKLFADGTDIALTVVKSGAVKNAAYEVDGVTGATLTSKGVAEMVQEGLTKYAKFILAD